MKVNPLEKTPQHILGTYQDNWFGKMEVFNKDGKEAFNFGKHRGQTVEEVFKIIEKKLNENPIKVLVKAVENVNEFI